MTDLLVSVSGQTAESTIRRLCACLNTLTSAKYLSTVAILRVGSERVSKRLPAAYNDRLAGMQRSRMKIRLVWPSERL